jgi:hypothetical protein
MLICRKVYIRDLVKQAVTHSVYRLKPNGKLYEGEYEIAEDEDTLIKLLADDDNQDMLLMLEVKLNLKNSIDMIQIDSLLYKIDQN